MLSGCRPRTQFTPAFAGVVGGGATRGGLSRRSLLPLQGRSNERAGSSLTSPTSGISLESQNFCGNKPDTTQLEVPATLTFASASTDRSVEFFIVSDAQQPSGD